MQIECQTFYEYLLWRRGINLCLLRYLEIDSHQSEQNLSEYLKNCILEHTFPNAINVCKELFKCIDEQKKLLEELSMHYSFGSSQLCLEKFCQFFANLKDCYFALRQKLFLF